MARRDPSQSFRKASQLMEVSVMGILGWPVDCLTDIRNRTHTTAVRLRKCWPMELSHNPFTCLITRVYNLSLIMARCGKVTTALQRTISFYHLVEGEVQSDVARGWIPLSQPAGTKPRPLVYHNCAEWVNHPVSGIQL